MKRIRSIVMAMAMILTLTACGADTQSTVDSQEEAAAPTKSVIEDYDGPKYELYASMEPEDIAASMTIEQKAEQMVQPIQYTFEEKQMKESCYGSVYGDEGMLTEEEWRLPAVSHRVRRRHSVRNGAGRRTRRRLLYKRGIFSPQHRTGSCK